MEILQATSQDGAKISRIFAASWKKGYKGLVAQDYLDGLRPDHWTAFLEEALESGKLWALLALEGERPAGALAYGAYRPPTGSQGGGIPGGGYIQALYVHPDYMGRGCGTALLQAGEAALAAQGYGCCFLYVLDTNAAARRFYEKQGYAWDGYALSCKAGEQPLVDLRYRKEFS